MKKILFTFLLLIFAFTLSKAQLSPGTGLNQWKIDWSEPPYPWGWDQSPSGWLSHASKYLCDNDLPEIGFGIERFAIIFNEPYKVTNVSWASGGEYANAFNISSLTNAINVLHTLPDTLIFELTVNNDIIPPGAYTATLKVDVGFENQSVTSETYYIDMSYTVSENQTTFEWAFSDVGENPSYLDYNRNPFSLTVNEGTSINKNLWLQFKGSDWICYSTTVGTPYFASSLHSGSSPFALQVLRDFDSYEGQGSYSLLINTTIPGIYTDTLIIQTSSPAEPIVYIPLTLDVIGLPSTISVSTTNLDFGTLELEDAIVQKSIEITNTGSHYLLFSDPLIIGGNNCFSIAISITNVFSPIPPGTSYTIFVDFNPLIVGSQSATLRIDNNSSNMPRIDIPLSGIVASKISVEQPSIEVLQYSLHQNYPNPFNPSTNIDYVVADNSFVTMKVYNILGQEVSLLVNGLKERGKYTVTWNAANQPSGIYYYKLTAGNYAEVKKMILLK